MDIKFGYIGKTYSFFYDTIKPLGDRIEEIRKALGLIKTDSLFLTLNLYLYWKKPYIGV